MKKHKFSLILISLLLIVTAVTAGIHLSSRTTVPEECITISSAQGSSILKLSELNWSRVQGQIKNQKGDVRDIDAQGISVKDALTFADIDLNTIVGIDVTAEDSYHAELRTEEILQFQNAYFIRQEEGGIRLIVFEDQNSKRNISDVADVRILE